MNKINKRRVTSVALAFTLAVAAPVKANFSNFNLELNKVAAAEVKETEETLNQQKTAEKAKLEAAKQEKANLEAQVKGQQQKITEATQKITENGDNSEATKEIAKANKEIERLKPLIQAEEQKITDATRKIEEIDGKIKAIQDAKAKEKAKKKLQDLVTEKEGALKVYKADGNYTDDSIKGLDDAIEAAKIVLEGELKEANVYEAAYTKLSTVKDPVKKAPEKSEADKFTGSLSVTKDRGAVVRATDLTGLPKGATVEDKLITNNLQTTETGTVKVSWTDGSSKLVNYTVYVRETSVYLNRPTVYYNKVTGRTTPYATVTLYRNGNRVDYVKADRYGDYTINYRFGDYRYDRYNGTASISSYGDRYVSGYTTANTYVQAYNNGDYLGSAYSDSRGYYTINFNKYVYNRNNTVVYTNGYNNSYNNGYGYYDLSDYYLQAELDGKYSEKQYLNKAYIDRYYNNGYYNNYAYAPRITQAIAGTSTVKGSGVNGYATVAVYDSKGIRLGSGTAYSNGEFTISLNRDLKAGEEIKVTANYSNLRENSTTYKVAGESKKDTYNYVVNLTIGDKRLTTTKDGVTTTTTMDVEAYIKEGRTMLPIRFVAQALGYNVTFNDTTRLATFTDGKKVVIINIDSRDFYVDGIKNTFSVDPEIKQGRTMLPISEIGKALGMTTGNKGDNKNIEWDSVRREVKIQLTK